MNGAREGRHAAGAASLSPSGGYIGTSVPLLQGDLLVTGQARFVADLDLPGMLHVAILRSPHAHARIASIDLSGAASAPGVVRALTGEDARRHIGQVPHRTDPTVFGGRHADIRCLAVGKVIYAGQPVAAVAASTREQARAALRGIRVIYEPMPVVVDGEAALAADAPRVIEDWPDNVLHRGGYRSGDVDAVFHRAASDGGSIVRATIRIHRYSTQPIETRAYAAIHNRFDDTLTVYATSQNPHQMRHMLAAALGRPENRIRIIVPRLGGAFGIKMIGHPEESLICLFAVLTGRPVKWVEDREDTLVFGGREQVHHVEVAATREGRLTALRDHFVANVGAPYPTPGWGMVGLTAVTLPCAYDLQDVDIQYTAVVTNKGPWTASRGYGKEASNLVMERTIDLVAARLGIDPIEIRMRNFIPPEAFPYRSATALEIDSGDYPAVLRQAAQHLDYASWRARQAEMRAGGRLVGIGVAFELTPEGGSMPRSLIAGYDTTTVRVDPSGTVLVLTGVTNPGGGNDTGIAQVVADELGVEPSAVRVIQGDTDLCPYGFGNYSGRSMIVGGGSARLAARDVREKLARVAGALLGAEPNDLTFRGGRIVAPGAPDRVLSLAAVAYAAYARAYEAASVIEPPLEATRTYKPPHIRHVPDERGRLNTYLTYSNGAYLAVVDVDGQTGRVRVLDFAATHDCGVMVNPSLVDGQLTGAIAMGVGAALGEELRYDAEGRRLTTSFKEYLMPRAGDLPSIALGHHVTPSPFTLLGTKGGGEAGVGGAKAAVMNAVADALAPLGVEVVELPLRPPALWRAIRAAQGAAT
jgi:carbon-monoxide dehydrogenase large subunit